MCKSLLIAVLCVIPVVAGAQWATATSGTDAEFRGLSTAGASVVCASRPRGRYARSTDGGHTWRVDSVPTASALDFRAVRARYARRAWLIGAGEAGKRRARLYRP